VSGPTKTDYREGYIDALRERDDARAERDRLREEQIVTNADVVRMREALEQIAHAPRYKQRGEVGIVTVDDLRAVAANALDDYLGRRAERRQGWPTHVLSEEARDA
jgi:hypothetical protein